MSDEPNSLTDHERALIAEAIEAERQKRRRAQLALAAAVLLIVACGGVFAKWREQKHRVEQAEAARLRAESEREADAVRAEAEGRAAAEQLVREAQTRKMRQSVRDSLVLAADARTPEEIRLARELLDDAAELAKIAAPDLLPEVERGRHFLAPAPAREPARPEPAPPEPGPPVAPPPRAVNR